MLIVEFSMVGVHCTIAERKKKSRYFKVIVKSEVLTYLTGLKLIKTLVD
jgi:hypothetical protein